MGDQGPRIGDAASLWNFTPAPGWSREEAQVLKLCLMKFGVGRWVQILDSGLLPGKLIQQLNGQTQRLLGQQSLAAYTGLQVDIDRIRAENEARRDVDRKQGLVVNSGPNLSKQQKEELQRQAQEKYGLMPEQLRRVEEQIAELQASRLRPGMANGAAEAEAGDAGSSGTGGSIPALIALDTSECSKEEKVAFLIHLHAKLQLAMGRLGEARRQLSGGGSSKLAAPAVGGPVVVVAGPSRQAPTAAGRAGSRTGSRAGGGKGSSRGSGGRRRGKSRDLSDSDTEVEAALEAELAAEVREAAAARPVRATRKRSAVDLQMQQLCEMGYSAQMARDALEECGGNVHTAAEWLLINCGG